MAQKQQSDMFGLVTRLISDTISFGIGLTVLAILYGNAARDDQLSSFSFMASFGLIAAITFVTVIMAMFQIVRHFN